MKKSANDDNLVISRLGCLHSFVISLIDTYTWAAHTSPPASYPALLPLYTQSPRAELCAWRCRHPADLSGIANNLRVATSTWPISGCPVGIGVMIAISNATSVLQYVL